MGRTRNNRVPVRNRSDGITEQSNVDQIDEKTCPKCEHNRMWKPRGRAVPQYRNKCCKCGFIIRFKESKKRSK